MAEVLLSCRTLGDLDMGLAELAIDHEIQKAIIDLENRGHDEEKRKVCINVEFQKKKGVISATVKAQAKLPALRTDDTVAKVIVTSGKARLQFQKDAPDNPDQRTFLDGDHDRPFET